MKTSQRGLEWRPFLKEGDFPDVLLRSLVTLTLLCSGTILSAHNGWGGHDVRYAGNCESPPFDG